MSELRISQHKTTGAAVFEVVEDGKVIAAIYADPKQRAIKILSKTPIETSVPVSVAAGAVQLLFK